jgi:spectinomycin phosphotransferase
LFVTADQADTGSPIPLAYDLARRLADDGLSFVRAPIPHRFGGVTRDLDGWLVSVWPWLEGRASEGHEHRSAADLEATTRCLRMLHEHRSIPPVPGLVEDWSIAERTSLFDLLGRDSREWGSGPYTDEVRSRVSASRDTIMRQFRRYDELSQTILSSGMEFVITHGEPHAANVVHTDAGPMLIDWDTVRWAPRERDVWALNDSWRGGYGEVAVSDEALEAYRLQWSLGEIAEFATELAAARDIDPDLEVALRELRSYLPG